MTQTLLFATSNADKIKEMRGLLSEIPYLIVTPAEIGLDIEVEEPFTTFAENAAHKASVYAAAAHMPAFADDSGLIIDAMPDELGVYSARYCGYTTPYNVRFQKIAEKLAAIPAEKRTARYWCALAMHVPQTGKVYITEGSIEGKILLEPRGNNGFGYDPIFYTPEYHATMAELAPEIKAQISHRRIAAYKLAEILQEPGILG